MSQAKRLFTDERFEDDRTESASVTEVSTRTPQTAASTSPRSPAT